MERLAGPRAPVPKGPSAEKKTESAPRGTSQTRRGSGSATKGVLSSKGGSLNKPTVQTGMKKDSAKELLMKMKEIKAHYNSQATKNVGSSKNIVNKISDLTDKKP